MNTIFSFQIRVVKLSYICEKNENTVMEYKTSLEPGTKRANLCPSDLGKQWGTD